MTTTELEAVVHIDADALPAIRAAQAAASTIGSMAARLKVDDAISAEQATNLLGQIVGARRHAEAQRKELVGPLNGVVAKINAAAKRTMEPLKEMETDLKTKLVAYQREQEERAERERARLAAEAAERRRRDEEERHAAEAKLRAEREAAAREAARAETNAQAARVEAQRRLDETADALTHEVRHATNEDLAMLTIDADEARALAATDELKRRREIVRAEQAATVAREREEAARAAEEAVANEPALPDVVPAVAAPARLQGGGARVSVRKTWTFEVVDDLKVPRDYLQVDVVAVRTAIRGGVREIRGLRIYEAENASVTL